MILEIRLSNFFSIKDEVVLDMQAASIQTKKAKELEENTFVCGNERLLKTVAIYGANASGKTNILNAIGFFRMLVLRMPKDRNAKTGVVPFMLDDTSRNEKTKMSMVFYINQSKYIISLELDERYI